MFLLSCVVLSVWTASAFVDCATSPEHEHGFKLGFPKVIEDNPELGAPVRGVGNVHCNAADSSAGIDVRVSYVTPWQEHAHCRYGFKRDFLNLKSVPTVETGVRWLRGYSGFAHHAVLSPLSPDTRYFYSCSNDTVVRTFKTQKLQASTVKAAVFADMGIDNSAETMAKLKNREDISDFFYHIGDISYADDHVLSYEATWNAFFRLFDHQLGSLQYFVGPGNHEYGTWDPFIYEDVVNFQTYNKLFRMPHPVGERSNSSMFYSFNWGPVHFVMISTESSYPDAPHGDVTHFGDQMKWLKADLALANTPAARRTRPWIVVSGHRPIYSSAEGYSIDGVPIDSPIPEVPMNSATLQRVFEPLFIDNKVDLVLAGHVHSYERIYPTKNSKLVQKNYHKPTAPSYVVVGNAGNIEGTTHFADPAPWTAYRYNHYGYAMLEANMTALNWKFHAATDDKILDEFTITK